MKMTNKFMMKKEVLVFEDTIEDIIKNLRLLDKTYLSFKVYLKKDEFYFENMNLNKYEIVYTSEHKDIAEDGYIFISDVRDLLNYKYSLASQKACEQLGYDPDSDEAEESDKVYNLTKELEKDLIIEDLMAKIKGELSKKHKNETVWVKIQDNDIFEFKF